MANWRDDTPVVPITQAQVDASLQCSICLEDFRYSEQVRRLDCSHVYHETCIAPWLNRHNICPTCRRINGGLENGADHFTDVHDDEEEANSDDLDDEDEMNAESMSVISFDSFMLDSNTEEDMFFGETSDFESDIFEDECCSPSGEEEQDSPQEEDQSDEDSFGLVVDMLEDPSADEENEMSDVEIDSVEEESITNILLSDSE